VTVRNNQFDPGIRTVAPNSTVTWTWDSCGGGSYNYGTGEYDGETCVNHSVLWADGTGSGTKSEGVYQRQFTAPGTYNYQCSEHGTAMSGTITVQ
jgi:plastocyanin